MWDRIWDCDLSTLTTPITNFKECFDAILNYPGYSPESEMGFCWAARNFSKLIEYSEFLEFNDLEIIELLSHPELEAYDEEVVFDGVKIWLEHHEDSRKKVLVDFLNQIRTFSMRPKYLLDGLEPVCYDAPTCRRMYYEAIRWHMIPKERKFYDETKAVPRKLFARMLSVGSCDFRTCGVIEHFDTDTNVWKELKPMNIKLIKYGVALVNKKLMLIGGHDETYSRHKKPTNEVSFYDLETGKMTSAAPLNENRHTPGIAVMDYGNPVTVYAIGGMVKEKATNIVEKWDTVSQKWTWVTSMQVKREGCGVAVVDNLIYVGGGKDGIDDLDSVELYNPKEDKWTMLAKMNHQRSHFKLVSNKGYLYAFGGYLMGYGTLSLNYAERYNPKLNIWEDLPDSTYMAMLGCGTISGQLFYIGGGNLPNRFIKNGEKYDELCKKWVEFPSLNVARAGITVVNLPINMLEYKLCE